MHDWLLAGTESGQPRLLAPPIGVRGDSNGIRAWRTCRDCPEHQNGLARLRIVESRYWRENILPSYSDEKLRTDILLGSHHGSLTFFDDPADEKQYYTSHIKKINPAMTLISVGDNAHDLPDSKAIELYEKYSRGSDKGNKLYRTDEQGNMKLALKDDGTWKLWINQ